MKTSHLVLLVFLLMTAQTAAADNAYLGRGGGDFLKAQPGVRPLGMGNAVVAVVDDADAIAHNPAGLAIARSREVNAMFSSQEFDQTLGSLAGVAPLGAGAVGVAFHYLSVKDISLRPAEFDLSADASSLQTAFLLSYGRAWGTTSFGATVKYLSHSFEGLSEKGRGAGLDLGLLHRQERLSLGAALRNAAGRFHWSTGRNDPLLATVQAGAAYQWRPWLLTALDMEGGDGRSPRLHAGVEGRYRTAAFRAGMDHSHPTFGFGVDFPAFGKTRWGLDYALEFNTDGLKDEHLFRLRALF